MDRPITAISIINSVFAARITDAENPLLMFYRILRLAASRHEIVRVHTESSIHIHFSISSDNIIKILCYYINLINIIYKYIC